MSTSALAELLNDATIEYGSSRPEDGGARELFGVNTSSASYWFEAKLEFAENGNDFSMKILRFGYLGRDSVLIKSFSKSDIEEIKKFLERYLADTDVRLFSIIVRGKKPLCIQYADSWIIEENGDTYRYTPDGSLRKA